MQGKPLGQKKSLSGLRCLAPNPPQTRRPRLPGWSLHPETQTPGNPGLTWHRFPILLSVTGSPIPGLGRFLPSSSRQAQHLPKGRAPIYPPQGPQQRPSHPSPNTPPPFKGKNIEPGRHYNRSRSILISGSKCLQGTCPIARAMTEKSELLYTGPQGPLFPFYQGQTPELLTPAAACTPGPQRETPAWRRSRRSPAWAPHPQLLRA